MDKKHIEKEAIIAEYLLGNFSYRQLGLKHGIDFRMIHSWVTKFKGKPMRKSKPVIKNEELEQLPTDVKLLQEELRI